MTTARERAEEVARMQHVRQWVARFKSLSKDMPPEVEVFVASGTPVILARSETGDSFTKGGYMGPIDQTAEVASIPGGRWDGGDF